MPEFLVTPAVKNELHTLVGGGFDQWSAGLGDAQRTARALRDLVDLTDDAPATGYDWAPAATCRETHAVSLLHASSAGTCQGV